MSNLRSEPPTASNPSQVKSVRRTADVLSYLAEHHGAVRLNEIATSLAIPMSSAHALLHTLVSQGILTASASNEYSLSLSFLGRMTAAFDGSGLRALARPAMQQLSRLLGTTCNLGVLDGPHVVYLEQVRDTSHPVQLSTDVGTSLPAHLTALGKVLVAELPKAQAEEWVQNQAQPAAPAHTVSHGTDMRQAIARYEEKGYAVDDEELVAGVYCLAVAVRDYSGAAVAALSITTFKSQFLARWDGDDTSLAATVAQTATQISDALRGKTN